MSLLTFLSDNNIDLFHYKMTITNCRPSQKSKSVIQIQNGATWTSKKNRDGIRCHRGVTIPYWPVAPAVCSLQESWILHTHIVNFVVLLWYDCMVLTLWILNYEHILYIFIAILMLIFVLCLKIINPFYEKNHVMSNYINNKLKCIYNDWIYPLFYI